MGITVVKSRCGTKFWLEQAIRYAQRSPQKRYRTGAVIVRNSELLAAGWSHESQLRLNGLRSIHAEMHAIRRAPRGTLEGAICYVACVYMASGSVTLGRPCRTCAEGLLNAGVEIVHFTVPEDGTAWRADAVDLLGDLSELRQYRGRSWSQPVAA